MIGLLLDSLSNNTGDRAICEVMIDFLKAQQCEFDLVSPLGYDHRRYDRLIIGGGHLIRSPGDLYYDNFRVPGEHILNTVGVSSSDSLDYLKSYLYVSVRSQADYTRIGNIVPGAAVVPCVSLFLEPDASTSLVSEGAIGFHFDPFTWQTIGDISLFAQFKDYQLVLVPVMHYTDERSVFERVACTSSVPVAVLPPLPPRKLLFEIGRLKAFVTTSLHGTIFAYAQNVPFLSLGTSEKITAFLKDRGLTRYTFRNVEELREKLFHILATPPDFSSLLNEDRIALVRHFSCLKELLPKTQVSNPSSFNPVLPAPRDYLLTEHHHCLTILRTKVFLQERNVDLMRMNIVDLQRRLLLLQKEVSEHVGEAPRALQLPMYEQDLGILGRVESPNDGDVVQESLVLSGWAIAREGVAEIRVVVDGTFVTTADERLERLDVARRYPGYPDHPYAGWRVSIDAGGLSPGWHELMVQVTAGDGSVKELARFAITKATSNEGAGRSDERLQRSASPPLPNTMSLALSELKAQVVALSNSNRTLLEELARIDAECERQGDELGWLRSTIGRINQEGSRHATLLSQGRSAVLNLQDELNRLRKSYEDMAQSLAMASSRINTHDLVLGRLRSRIMEITQMIPRVPISGRAEPLNDPIEELPSLIQDLIGRQAILWEELSALKGALSAIREKTPARRLKSFIDRYLKQKKVTEQRCDRSADSDQLPPPGATCGGTAPGDGSGSDLIFNIESPLPSSISCVSDASFPLHGWCYHRTEQITNLYLQIGLATQLVDIYGIVRPDVYAVKRDRFALRSGFFCSVHMHSWPSREQIDIALLAKLKSGRVISTRLGTISIQGSLSRPSVEVPTQQIANKPLVAICMATYNPRLDLLARQVTSIQNQTYDNWIVVISDDCSSPDCFDQMLAIINGDKRFIVSRSETRLGFYRNFERALYMVPEEARFIALSDQDDYWHCDKIQTLIAACTPPFSLAYSDVRLINENGEVLSDTYWTGRRNNYRNFASLVLANTVSGAATLFPRSLLNLVLPFPRVPGELFHDHWIACTARSVGRIAYVHWPLNDYVQHGANVIGHSCTTHPSFLRSMLRVLSGRAAVAQLNAQWSSIYHGDLLRLVAMSSVLLKRCGEQLGNSERRTLSLFRSLNDSWFSAMWLMVRSLRQLIYRNETLWAETRVLRGFLWSRLVIMAVRVGLYPLVARLGRVPAHKQPSSFKEEVETKLRNIEHKIAPLSLQVIANRPYSVNILIPTVDFRYFFAGYIAKFQFARRLLERGHKVRIVIVDHCHFHPESWSNDLAACAGLKDHKSLNWFYAFDRSEPMPVGDKDVFVATTWWTAHIAHAATRAIGGNRFIYLIQEYEPFTFPMGSLYCLADESYRLPHYAVFSTEFLRDYFRKNRLGVFGKAEDVNDMSVVLQNAISPVGQPETEALRRRRVRKLLFYARFEEHAARNMAEVGFLALKRAIARGGFGKNWEFHAIGSVSGSFSIPLGQGFNLHVFERKSYINYAAKLQEYDLGLALILTPHPSLVPIEMAAAGLLVVTNTFDCKTREGLCQISQNIIPVEPSVDQIADALIGAAQRVSDIEARVQGAKVNWPRDWSSALNNEVMDVVDEFIRKARAR